MQGQKQEFSRKQRKLFSRDRSGLTRNPNRVRSRESDQKYILDQNSPKPKHLILGIRNELTSLRQEVAKLSRRDNNNNKPEQEEEVRLEYRGYSPRQKKITNPHFLEQSKSQRHNHTSRNSRNLSREEATILKTEERPTSVDRKLNAQLIDLQKKNKELEVQNSQLRLSITQLSQQFRKDYENKLKNLERQRDRVDLMGEAESDRTVIIQKQNQQQQQMIQELRENIAQVNKSNAEMRREIKGLQSHLRQNEKLKQQLIKKDKEIKEIKSQLISSHKEQQLLQQQLLRADQMQKQLDNRQKEAYEQLQKIRKELVSCQQERDLQNGNMLQLRKLCKSYEQEMQLLKDNCQKGRAQAQGPQQKDKARVRQLQEAIKMHVKCIQNYQSDFHYLEGQLAKLSLLKPFAESLALLTEDLNQECVRLRLGLLNLRYERY